MNQEGWQDSSEFDKSGSIAEAPAEDFNGILKKISKIAPCNKG